MEIDNTNKVKPVHGVSQSRRYNNGDPNNNNNFQAELNRLIDLKEQFTVQPNENISINQTEQIKKQP